MLLIVAWSSVVVWLNVRPRYVAGIYHNPEGKGLHACYVEFGCPWSYAGCFAATATNIRPLEPVRIDSYPALAANAAIGLLAVAVLTWTSRASIAVLRAFMSKPPPADVDGD